MNNTVFIIIISGRPSGSWNDAGLDNEIEKMLVKRIQGPKTLADRKQQTTRARIMTLQLVWSRLAILCIDL